MVSAQPFAGVVWRRKKHRKEILSKKTCVNWEWNMLWTTFFSRGQSDVLVGKVLRDGVSWRWRWWNKREEETDDGVEPKIGKLETPPIYCFHSNPKRLHLCRVYKSQYLAKKLTIMRVCICFCNCVNWILNARTVATATQMTQIRRSWKKKSSKAQCNNTLRCNTFIPPFWWV